MHPDAFDDVLPLSEDPKIRDKQIELRAYAKEHGRDIGRTDKQPSWCPLVRKTK